MPCTNPSRAGLCEVEFNFVDVTPAPGLARFYGLHDGVLRVVKVLRSVLVLGRIAAPDVAAFHAKAQVNPRVAHFQAFFATICVRSDLPNLI